MIFTPRQARVVKGLTQRQVAENMNVHVQTYMKLEKNPEGFTIKQAKQFAEIVKIPYDQISFFR